MTNFDFFMGIVAYASIGFVFVAVTILADVFYLVRYAGELEEFQRWQERLGRVRARRREVEGELVHWLRKSQYALILAWWPLLVSEVCWAWGRHRKPAIAHVVLKLERKYKLSPTGGPAS